VTRIVLGLLLAVPLFAADPALDETLKLLERRYNSAKTLHIGFEETYSVQGRGRKTESGELYLRKPGKMRWDYKNPAGKLFISDGKDLYYYTPSTQKAEKMKLKEADDMRAPLAFLLGKLDFDKEFQNFQFKQEGQDRIITADAKSDRLPYKKVEFTVTPMTEIRKLNVWNQDSSQLTFVFTNERMNPTLDNKLFRFDLPAGATLTDMTQTAEQEGSR
jgi:outer membrane lipoprotein carrier protein